MNIDFDRVESLDDFVTVPNGTYLCRVAEVQTARTRHGDERWSLRLIVAEGEFTGRLAAFDSLVFSPRGMQRVKYVFGVLGLPNSGQVDVRPEQLVGKQVFADVRDGRYENPETGTVVRRNEIPYRGYRPVPESGPDEDAQHDAGSAPPSTDSIPF